MGSLRSYVSAAFSMSKSCYQSSLLRNSTNLVSFQHYSSTYEGEGKTHAILLNDEKDTLMINSYSEIGFSLNNGITILGPMAIFPNCVLSWNVGSIADINEESLCLFLKLEPKLDIIVLGLPEYKKKDRKIALELSQLIRKFNIQVEILPSEIACPTFNFLHAEQRFVGAGIIPPLVVDGYDAAPMSGLGPIGYIKND